MIKLKTYLLITMGHLLPVELFFYLVAHSGIDNLEYINYMYMVAVAMHGIFWFSKKLQPYVNCLDMLVNYSPEIQNLFELFRKRKTPTDALTMKRLDAELNERATQCSIDEKEFLARIEKVKGK